MTTTQRIQHLTSETIETLNNRVSVRDYSARPLDDATMTALLNAAQRTSTSSNSQTYSFVVVRAAETKRQLAALAGNQQHVIDCPVFVAVCADLTRLAQAAVSHGEKLALNLEMSMVSVIDAALAGQSLSLAAESLGLGIVMIGGMRNHPQEVADLLGLPEGVFVVFGLCIGWYAEKPVQKPRLPAETVVHFETYRAATESELAGYDSDLAGHYRAQGRLSPDAAWTGVVTQKYSRPQRPSLKTVLERRGFRFD